MSSILKALKKIEQDASPADEFPSWPHDVDRKKAARAPAKKRWFSSKRVAVLLIVIVILAAGWQFRDHWQTIIAKVDPLIFSESGDSTPPMGSNQGHDFRANIEPEPVQSTPLGKRSVQSPNNRRKTIQTRNSTKKQPAQRRPTKDAANRGPTKPTPPYTAALSQKYAENAARTASKNSIVASKSQNISGKRSSGSNRTPARSTKAKITNPSKVPNTTTQVPQMNKKPAKLDRLDDSNMQLQAIAWSDDVARRMVVINGRIVREGESIEGFSVTEIRPEDVVVNDGNKSWSLEFRLRRLP